MVKSPKYIAEVRFFPIVPHRKTSHFWMVKSPPPEPVTSKAQKGASQGGCQHHTTRAGAQVQQDVLHIVVRICLKNNITM